MFWKERWTNGDGATLTKVGSECGHTCWAHVSSSWHATADLHLYQPWNLFESVLWSVFGSIVRQAYIDLSDAEKISVRLAGRNTTAGGNVASVELSLFFWEFSCRLRGGHMGSLTAFLYLVTAAWKHGLQSWLVGSPNPDLLWILAKHQGWLSKCPVWGSLQVSLLAVFGLAEVPTVRHVQCLAVPCFGYAAYAEVLHCVSYLKRKYTDVSWSALTVGVPSAVSKGRCET